jgi:hypothetical protein
MVFENGLSRKIFLPHGKGERAGNKKQQKEEFNDSRS